MVNERVGGFDCSIIVRGFRLVLQFNVALPDLAISYSSIMVDMTMIKTLGREKKTVHYIVELSQSFDDAIPYYMNFTVTVMYAFLMNQISSM